VTAVRFERRDTITAITFGYDAVIVETIKLVVPSFLRSWNRIRREWLILEPVYAAELARVLRGAGYTVVGLDDPPDRRAGDAAGWARAVFQRVGATRAALAYRTLSRIGHQPATTSSCKNSTRLTPNYRPTKGDPRNDPPPTTRLKAIKSSQVKGPR
jgi:hypothetical protein